MWLQRVLLFAFAFAVANGSTIGLKASDVDVTLFSNELDLWVRLEQVTDTFKAILQTLILPNELQREDWRSFTGERGTGICTLCQSVVKTFVTFRRAGMSEESIKTKLIKLCTLLNLQTERVCQGVITHNLPIFIYIIDSNPNLTASTMCGVVLESKDCPLHDKKYEWTVEIDNGPPKYFAAKDDNQTINIVHITDLHYDPNYEAYGNPECNEPICCRKGQNGTNTSNKLAGFWGDYNYCDTPWHAIVDALDHIKSTHQNIEYVYFTGDIIDHGVWETSKSGNIEALNRSYMKIHETFIGVPVYPILGNHEPHPVNQFAPENVTDELSTQWLYDMMADLWIKFGWLPESTRSTILRGGFYTVVPKRGFRIIALNNNICYCYNWWQFHEPRDPYGQLQWLAETLLEAERNEEFVHILAHVPGNDKDCQSTWKREYLKIVDRFAHIITAQFNGHSHNDELQIFYKPNATKANNVAWNGGSVTSYTKLNPNYKIYTAKKSNLVVEDYDNWMYNLTEANENPMQRPNWFKSYSFKEEYNLSDLSLDSLSNWLIRMANDTNVLNRYYRHFFKNVDSNLMPACNENCKKNYICRIIATTADQQKQCAILTS